jgi:hypothetical protein
MRHKTVAAKSNPKITVLVCRIYQFLRLILRRAAIGKDLATTALAET